jgi:hypothetical protein
MKRQLLQGFSPEGGCLHLYGEELSERMADCGAGSGSLVVLP